jgi:hypothetical protein
MWGLLWSEVLHSYLEPAGDIIRFYDHEGDRRLTGEEAEKYRAEAAEDRAEAAEARAERAARAAKASHAALKALRTRLQAAGIDPDQVQQAGCLEI